MTHLIALTSHSSGVGKDTLADMLVAKYLYRRMSFGDFLRTDVIDTYGKPRSEDERSPDCYPLGLDPALYLLDGKSMSTKDAMLYHGAKVVLSNPLRYTEAMYTMLAAHVKQCDQPVVVTDMRKPVEMRMLAAFGLQNTLHTYFISVTSQTRGEARRLDGWLTGAKDFEYGDHSSLMLKPELPMLHGTIANDGQPEDMIDQLSKILEVTVPYGWQ
jgi:hypothetical protein